MRKPTSRFECNDWGPKEDTTSSVIAEKHSRFLRKLIDLGIDGFRFDAAKHILPSSEISLIHSEFCRLLASPL